MDSQGNLHFYIGSSVHNALIMIEHRRDANDGKVPLRKLPKISGFNNFSVGIMKFTSGNVSE